MTEFQIEIKNEQRSEGNYSLYCCSNGFQWWYMGLTYGSIRTAMRVQKFLLESKGSDRGVFTG